MLIILHTSNKRNNSVRSIPGGRRRNTRRKQRTRRQRKRRTRRQRKQRKQRTKGKEAEKTKEIILDTSQKKQKGKG